MDLLYSGFQLNKDRKESVIKFFWVMERKDEIYRKCIIPSRFPIAIRKHNALRRNDHHRRETLRIIFFLPKSLKLTLLRLEYAMRIQMIFCPMILHTIIGGEIILTRFALNSFCVTFLVFFQFTPVFVNQSTMTFVQYSVVVISIMMPKIEY